MLRTSLLATAFALAAATAAPAQSSKPVVNVIKQAECGCCGGWVTRMQQAGFTVNARNVSGEELTDAKIASGLSEDLWACHTSTVAGYTVEGHVPIGDVVRLLSERPDVIGIAAPGMPMGSPGMDYGSEREAFDVVLVRNDGSTEIYSSYPGN